MTLPNFPVVGNLREILAAPTSGEISDRTWTDAYVILAHNIEPGVLVWGGKIYSRPPSLKATVDPTTGAIEIGDTTVELLDNDPGLNVTGIQWRCDIKTSSSTTIASFWFDAPGDGSQVDLATVAHVPPLTPHPVSAMSINDLTALLNDRSSPVREILTGVYGTVINVKDPFFGAHGDNSFNDSAAIQDALDSAHTDGGGTVLLPYGAYRVEDLTFYSDVDVIGANKRGSILRLKAGSTLDVLKSEGFDDLTGTTAGGGVAGARIANLSIDGNKSQAPSGGKGLAVFGPNFLIENVDVRNCHGHGFVLDYAASSGGFVIDLESRLINCRAFLGDADGFHVLGGHDSYARGCIAAANAGVGFKTSGLAWNWNDCHSWGVQQYAWQISGQNFLTNCHGEGGSLAQFFIDWHEVTIIGGSAFAPDGASSKGLVFADWLPERTIIKGMRFFGFGSGSGPAMDLTNLGPQSHIDATIDQASGTAIVGSPPGDAYINVQVGGGTTTPSLVQVPGFYNPPTNPPAVVDSFTAADGSAPDSTKWTKTVGSGAAAAVNVQGNALQLKCGADGGYSSDDFVSLASTLGATLVDGELLFRLTSSSITTESYLLVGLRSADADPLAGATAYILKIAQNTNSTWQVVVMKRVSSSNTNLVNLPVAAVTNGQKTWFRFRVEGTKLTLRKWADGTAEPIVPTWSGTDSSIAGGGLATFALNGGAAAANGIQKIDNIAIYAL